MSAESWLPIVAILATVLALLLVRARAELQEASRAMTARQQAMEAEGREAVERWKRAQEVEIREDAVRRSQAVVAGKATEHLAPYLPEFPFDPRDARFLGAPVDFVVFDGLAAGELREVVFVEIKTGASASLSPRERRVREVVTRGRVRFVELRLPGPDAMPLASSYYVPLEELEGIVSGQLELRPDEAKLLYWVDWNEPPIEYSIDPRAIVRRDARPWLKLAAEGDLLVLDLGGDGRLEVDPLAGRLVIEGRFYRLGPDRLGRVRGASALKLDGGR